MSMEQSKKTVKFNIGGTRHEVARSLLDMHSDSMLARMASEQWQQDPEAEIFVERDGERFKLVLDYLRDGKATVPFSMTKDAVLEDLAYYGISCTPESIKYSDQDVPIVLGIGMAKINELSIEADQTQNHADILKFAKGCLIYLFNEASNGRLLPCSREFSVYQHENKDFYDLSRKVHKIITFSKNKQQVVDICGRFGFKPSQLDPYSRSGCVRIQLESNFLNLE